MYAINYYNTRERQTKSIEFHPFTFQDLGNPLTMDTAKLFVRNWKQYENFFKASTLKEIIPNFNLRDFTTWIHVEADNIGAILYAHKQGNYLFSDNPTFETFKEWKGEWSREVRKKAYTFLIPSPYQSAESKLFKQCMELEYPYLSKYNVSYYKFEKANEWIYVRAENENNVCKSIYCPVTAFSTKDKQKIIDTHTNYFKGYYNTPNRSDYLYQALGLLYSDVAKQLFEDIERR